MLGFTSCQEVFDPDVDEVEPFLIIEGYLTTRPGAHQVILNTSAPFNSSAGFKRIYNAIVYVEDEAGTREYFNHITGGVYQTDTSSQFAARLRGTYTLTVVLEDGTRFVSSPQTVVPCPKVGQLYCSYDQQTILTENTYGEILEIPQDGFNVISNTQGILENNNHYFYRWIGYEQHMSYMRIEASEYYMYQHRRLSAKYSSILKVTNGDDFGNFSVKNNKMLFISEYDLTNYFPPVHDTLVEYVVSVNFQGLLFRLEQYSLTPEAFDFWNDAQSQLEAGGKLFDPVTPQLHGNMRCVSDSLTRVIGIFTVSDLSEKYAYFYIGAKNRTHSQDIDGFPELYLDSIVYRQPEDWIRPPF